jgi:hypothetical protein
VLEPYKRAFQCCGEQVGPTSACLVNNSSAAIKRLDCCSKLWHLHALHSLQHAMWQHGSMYKRWRLFSKLFSGVGSR